jgi:hypothetical protein
MDALTQDLETRGLPSFLMGFGPDDDDLHAPSENDDLVSFHGGTKHRARRCQELAKGAGKGR